MSMQDPIADMFSRIRNAQAVAKKQVSMPMSKIKMAIANVLKEEGYITDCEQQAGDNGLPSLVIALKYFEGRPVIASLDRQSRPGRRLYASKNELPQVQNGLGIAIISTSKGVMTDQQARRENQGGEVLCFVS